MQNWQASSGSLLLAVFSSLLCHDPLENTTVSFLNLCRFRWPLVQQERLVEECECGSQGRDLGRRTYSKKAMDIPQRRRVLRPVNIKISFVCRHKQQSTLQYTNLFMIFHIVSARACACGFMHSEYHQTYACYASSITASSIFDAAQLYHLTTLCTV